MVAIETKYIGATDTKGSRIKAKANGFTVTIPYPYELSGEAVHRKAAEALAHKMDWKGELIGGETDKGYVFVFKP